MSSGNILFWILYLPDINVWWKRIYVSHSKLSVTWPKMKSVKNCMVVQSPCLADHEFSKICVKRPHKNRQNKDFNDIW